MLKNCLILINVGKVHLCMTLIYKKICIKCKEILKFSKIVQTLNICNKIHTCYQNQVYGISKIYRCQKSNIQEEFHMEFPISYQKIFQLIHAGVVVLKIQYSGKIYLYFKIFQLILWIVHTKNSEFSWNLSLRFVEKFQNSSEIYLYDIKIFHLIHERTKVLEFW